MTPLRQLQAVGCEPRSRATRVAKATTERGRSSRWGERVRSGAKKTAARRFGRRTMRASTMRYVGGESGRGPLVEVAA